MLELDGSTPCGDALSRIVDRAQRRAGERAAAFRWDPSGAGAGVARRETPGLKAPLNILLADDQNTLFKWVRDARVQTTVLGQGTPPPPDALVLTRADRSKPEALARNVPDWVWRRVAAGSTKLVLDASGEGTPHSGDHSDPFHDFFRSRGLKPSRAAYVTQDRGYAADYRVYLGRRLPREDTMQVWLHDRYVQQLFARLHDVGEDRFAQGLKRHAAAPRNRGRRFLSLNNTLRGPRTIFLLKLLQAGLWDQGYVSVGWFDDVGKRSPTAAEVVQLIQRSSVREALTPALIDCVEPLIARSPTYLGVDASDPKLRGELVWRYWLDEYADCWFSVVTESRFSNRLHRVTEKSFKPHLNFHPFMVLGSLGSLRLIRAYGFDSFPDMFDEGYDDEPDGLRRLDMVLGQVERLCRMDEAELSRLDEAASETLIFNAWWGYVELPKLFRTHIDASVVDRLVEFCRNDES